MKRLLCVLLLAAAVQAWNFGPGGPVIRSADRAGLDLRFDTGLLDSRVTFTRSSVGTFYNDAGFLATANTNAARFDHDPVTGEPVGLLIEGARTNIIGRSEALDAIGGGNQWNSPTRATITANAALSPAGTMTADLVVESTATGTHLIAHQTSTFQGSGTPYVLSFYAKSAGQDVVRVDIDSGGGWTRARADFDASDCTTSAVAGAQTRSGQSVGNGWCQFTMTSASTATAGFLSFFLNGASSYTGDGVSGMYIWGVQIEEAAFPSSYIPTLDAANATRATDNATVSGFSGFNQSQGMIGLEGRFRAASSSSRTVASIDDGTNTDRFTITLDGSENLNFATVNSSGNDGASDGTGVIALDTDFAVYARYATDSVRAAVDGTLSPLDATADIPLTDSVTTIRLGQDAVGSPFFGSIRRFVYDGRARDDTYLKAQSE